MARKVVITSGKGGVGKTTICAGIGKSLANLDFRVLVADFDIGLNNLDIELEVDEIQYDILDALEGRCRPTQAVVQHKTNLSLYILPCAHTFDIGKIDLMNLKNLIENLSSHFDFILIDCPAGIEFGFHRAICVADEAIVVTTPHISAIRNANRVLSILNGFFDETNLVVNRVRKDFVQKKQAFFPEEIAKALDVSLLGSLFESDFICAGKGCSKQDEECFNLMAQNLANGQSVDLAFFERQNKWRKF